MTSVRLMISPALAALVCVTPYVSRTRTAAWVRPSRPPIFTSSRLMCRTKRSSREVARTPDQGDQQQDEVGTAGSGHGSTVPGHDVVAKDHFLKQLCRAPTVWRWTNGSCGS